MKILQCLLVVLCLFKLNIAKAQKEITESEIELRSHLKFEALKDSESLSSGTGVYFTLNLSENNRDFLYSVILIKKSVIKNATEIKLYFKKTDGVPYIMTIPKNSNHVIESDESSDFAAIVLGELRSEYKSQQNLVEPLFYTESFLSEIYPGSEEKDLLEIKKIMRDRFL